MFIIGKLFFKDIYGSWFYKGGDNQDIYLCEWEIWEIHVIVAVHTNLPPVLVLVHSHFIRERSARTTLLLLLDPRNDKNQLGWKLNLVIFTCRSALWESCVSCSEVFTSEWWLADQTWWLQLFPGDYSKLPNALDTRGPLFLSVAFISTLCICKTSKQG